MEAKKQQDNLESLFSKTFDQLEKFPTEADWNVPSDDVWQEIRSELHPPKKNRILPIWWSAAAGFIGLLLVSGLGQHYYYQAQLTELSVQLDSNEQKVEAMEATMQTIADSEAKELSAATAVDQEILAESSSTLLSVDQTADLVRQKSSKPVGNQNVGERATLAASHSATIDQQQQNDFSILDKQTPPTLAVSSKDQAAYALPVLSDLHQSTNDIVSTSNWAKTQNTTNPIALKSLDIPTLHANPTEPAFEETLRPIVRLDQKPAKRFYVGAAFSPLHSMQKGKNKIVPIENPVEAEKAYRAGLQLGVAFHSNWMIETGINYTQSNLDAQYPHRVAFSSENERMNAEGRYESTYDITLATRTGTIETDVALTRDAATSVEDGDRIQLDLDLAMQKRHLEIPVIGKYQVNLGPVSIHANAGIVSRYLIDQELNVNGIEAQTPGFVHHNTRVQSPLNGTDSSNKLSFHLRMGIGLDYQIHPNWTVGIEPIYERGLSPLYEFGNQQFYHEMLGVNFGVKYWM